MKKRILITFVVSLVLAFVLSVAVFAADGFKFERGSTFEITKLMRGGTPSTVEAVIYLDDNASSNGVIFGNYWEYYSNVPSVDFKIEAGGMPQIYMHTDNATTEKYSFDQVKIEKGKYVTVRFVIDRSAEGAHKALCFVDGALAQTIEAESISSLTSLPQMFVFGGNRTLTSQTCIANPNYFKGAISKLTVWQGAAYPDSTEAPILQFDYSAEGNTEEVIKDVTGNGYDAYYTERFISEEELPERIADYAYSFAVVGDPQYVAAFNPEAYKPMYEWLIDQDPKYVIGLGDIQDELSNTSDKAHTQWKVAQEAIYLLDDAGIPHTHVRGNHDYANIYKEYLPWEKYGSIYDGINAGAYEENVLNTWQTIEIGDTKWLILGIDYSPSAAVLSWAQGVVESHPEHNVIVATHYYMNRHGNVPSSNENISNILNNLVDKYANIVLVLCGHVHSDNILVNQRVNSVGTTVTEMLIDYQYNDTYYGDTTAVVTMFHFSEDGRTLQVENYSTYHEAYYKKANQFTVTLDLLDVDTEADKNEGTPDYELSSATKSGSIDGFTWSLCGDTLVISGSSINRTLSDGAAISALAPSVKRIVIENSTKIKALGDGLFSGFTACETVVVPARLNTIGSKTFSNMTSLTTVAYYNDYYGEGFDSSGVIDLYDINYFSSDSFDGASKNADVTVYMPFDAVMSGKAQKFTSAKSATYYILPSGDIADLVRDTADETVSVRYYTYEMTGDALLQKEGSNYTSDGTTVMFTWTFDDVTGKLTINFAKNVGASFKATQGYVSWKNIWKDAITSISLLGSPSYSKLQIYANQADGLLNGYKNLVSIYFAKNVSVEWQVSDSVGNFGMFSDNPKLTTVGLGKTTEGVVDLSPLTLARTYTFRQMFKGCKSITQVILPTMTNANATTNLYASTFEGCKSLVSVVIPSNFKTVGDNCFKDCTSLENITFGATVTTVSAMAFDGCTSLKCITLESESVPSYISSIPDKKNLIVFCGSAEIAESINASGTWEYTKAVFFDGSFDGSVKMEGFSIRLTKYNGLRGMFSFDERENAILEAAGYTLVEYGALATSETAYNSGEALAIAYENGAYRSNKGIKVRVYSAEDGYKLDDGTPATYINDDDITQFNVAIVRFADNYDSNIYMCAYSVYISPSGEELITYSHYSDDYMFFNLYDLTLDMYKAGVINASVSDEAAVWNTLLTGAVKTASGDVYCEIPAVGQTNDGYVASKNVTVTIVVDTDDANYVAIYRGNGIVPAQWNGWESSAYGGTSMQQLGKSFGTYSPASNNNAVPVLTNEECSRIKTVIMDHGITGIGRYGFVGLDDPTTYVYPATLESISNGAFFYNDGITTAYMAHVDDPSKVNEIGLVDFSGVDSCNLGSGSGDGYMGTFNHALSITKLHLPTNVTNTDGVCIFGSTKWYENMRLTKVWFGDNAEPSDGVIDMSNIEVTAIGKNAFRGATKITTLILPDSCTSIAATAFYKIESSTIMSKFKNVIQYTYNADIATYCAGKNIIYSYTVS